MGDSDEATDSVRKRLKK